MRKTTDKLTAQAGLLIGPDPFGPRPDRTHFLAVLGPVGPSEKVRNFLLGLRVRKGPDFLSGSEISSNVWGSEAIYFSSFDQSQVGSYQQDNIAFVCIWYFAMNSFMKYWYDFFVFSFLLVGVKISLNYSLEFLEYLIDIYINKIYIFLKGPKFESKGPKGSDFGPDPIFCGGVRSGPSEWVRLTGLCM